MASFYRISGDGATLAQGDIFREVPVVEIVLREVARLSGPAASGQYSAKVTEIGNIRDGESLKQSVRLERAIVISQSCDVQRSSRVLVAPVIEFPSQKAIDGRLWKLVQTQATSLSQTGLLYLPGNSKLGFRRSSADLGEAFSVQRTVLEELVKLGRREASLGKIAKDYLQYRLAIMLSRVAQDDYAWPSADDLSLKRKHLEDELERLRRKLSAKAEECGDIQDADAHLKALHERISELEKDLVQVENFSTNADDLES